MKGINENLENAEEKGKWSSDDYDPLAKKWFQKYLDANSSLDTTFGIRLIHGKPMMGDEVIEIDGNNIVINGETNQGPLVLITKPNPEHREYIRNDYEWYKEL